MASRKVELIYDVVDRATKKLQTINASMDKLKATAQKTGSAGAQIGSFDFTRSILQADLLRSAIGQIGNAAGFMFTGIKEASLAAGQNMVSAGGLIALTGQSMEDATSFVTEFREAMSKVASDLPGTTSEYTKFGNTLIDNIIPAFTDLNGQFERNDAQKYLQEITKNIGFLSAQQGADPAEAVQGISALLLGSSLAEAQRLAFFQKTSFTFLGLVKEEAQRFDKEFEDLDSKTRAMIIEKVSKRLTPDDVIEAAKSSMNGLIEGFRSQIFDIDTGVFGWMKDLNKMAGDQSAFAALTMAAKEVFGTNGVTDQIGKMLAEFGFSADDPMNAIRNGILFVNKYLTRFRFFLLGINIQLDQMNNEADKIRLFTATVKAQLINTFTNIAAFIQNIDIAPIVNSLVNIINTASNFLSGLDWNAFFIAVGIATGNALDAIVNGSRNINVGDLAILAGKIVGGFFAGVAAAIGAMDTSTQATLIAALFLKVGLAPMLTYLGAKLVGFMIAKAGMFTALMGASYIVPAIISLGKAILAAVTLSNPVGILAAFLVVGTAFLLYTAVRHWDKVKEILNLFFTSFTGWADVIVGIVTLDGDKVKEGFNKIFSVFRSLIDTILSAMEKADSYLNLDKRWNSLWGAPAPGTNGATPQADIDAATSLRLNPIPSLAEGFLPSTNIGSILGAVIRERSLAPAGSSIVVANDSEAILNTAQQSAIAQASGRRNGGMTISIGDIHSISNASDPNVVADLVLSKINRLFTERSQSMAGYSG